MSIGRLISDHKSLAELYSDLLHRQRGIVRREDDGTAMCVFCNQKLSDHRTSTNMVTLHYCDSSKTTVFTNELAEELNKTKRAITLIEELREL